MTSFRYWMLRFFSKPAWDRPLYKLATTQRPKAIVEFGLSSIERTLNLIQVAQRVSPGAEIKYCGVDLFDARPSCRPKLKLKDVHCQLQKSGAKIRLMPGEFQDVLARLANQLGKNDLILVTTNEEAASLASAWFWVPRMLEQKGLVLLRDRARKEESFKSLDFAAISRLAGEIETVRKVA